MMNGSGSDDHSRTALGSHLERSRCVSVGLALWAVCVAAAWSESLERPPFYAVDNVRVAVGNGDELDGATVLIADGLIEAVGVDLAVPEDAWRIDGEGLLLLPGMIDSLTGLGLGGGDGEGAPSAERGGPAARGPQISGPEDRPQTTPWRRAADELVEDRRIEKWREAGFTSAVVAPAKGIFTGQAALVNFGDGAPAEGVVASTVAQRIELATSGGFRTYPSSLMGVLSYVEQVFADVDHYEQTGAGSGWSEESGRSPFDRSLAPLAEARAEELPFLIPAQPGREIDRALSLAERVGVRGLLYGGHGAYERLDRLAAADAALLVSLDWPEAGTDRDPEADTPFPELFHRRMSPTSPAALAERGLTFAFYSDGLASTSDVLTGIRRAVEAGLSDAAALRALTLDAATIFGVEDRLGSVEVGKIANLVLATDWPWAEGAELRTVFVDGQKFDLDEPEEPGEAPSSDVSGRWELAMQTPGGAAEMTAELEMDEAGKVTGEISSPRGTTPIDEGRMSADLLRFETTREMGGRSMTASWSLTVEGETLDGAMSAGPMSMDVSGERTVAAEVAADDAEEALAVPIEEMRTMMEGYRGPVRELDRFAIVNASLWSLAEDAAGEAPIAGSVLVENGKIAAVGADVVVPDGVETFDAGGGALIPGIIDAHAHIAIEGGVNEGTLAVTSMARIADVIDPDDIGIYRALGGGVTVANLLHGSANPIGGQNAVVKLRWGSDAEGMKFSGAPSGIKFALGENPKRSNFSNPAIPDRYPKTRMGVMDVIREAFMEARDYAAAWQSYEREAAAAPKRRRGAGTAPSPPRRDLKLEALAEILTGERLVHSHCYRADEILQLLRLAEEFDFRVGTLQHVLEGYKVADEIAQHGAGASTFSDWWGFKIEAYDAIPYNAALMTERGVVVSINSDSGEEMRHLNQEAAKAVRWGGLSEVEALKLVTLNPAVQLGVADRVGSIEVGKDADLVLYDGHPLSTRSVVQKTFLDGDLYFDRAADAERQARINEIKLRLVKGDEDEDENADGDPGDEASEATAEAAEEDAPPDGETGAYWSERETYSCREVH